MEIKKCKEGVEWSLLELNREYCWEGMGMVGIDGVGVMGWIWNYGVGVLCSRFVEWKLWGEGGYWYDGQWRVYRYFYGENVGLLYLIYS